LAKKLIDTPPFSLLVFRTPAMESAVNRPPI
jgi:hypothetical protein